MEDRTVPVNRYAAEKVAPAMKKNRAPAPRSTNVSTDGHLRNLSTSEYPATPGMKCTATKAMFDARKAMAVVGRDLPLPLLSSTYSQKS